MHVKSILYPLFAQVGLTFIVWGWLIYSRVSFIVRNRIRPQSLADGADAERILKDVANPNDNFENLFEMPVLFYVAILLILVTNATDPFYLAAAWFFVLFRILHSLIHCTTNHVRSRAMTYAIGSLSLWVIWARLAYRTLVL